MSSKGSGIEPPTRFFVLGPLLAKRDGQSIDVGGPKQRLVLAALLLSSNRVVSVSRLIDLLWGDEANEHAQPTLHVYIAKLRKALASPFPGAKPLLETIRPGYRILVDEGLLDLFEFNALADQARQTMAGGHFDRASRLFRGALDLPRGPFLDDLADEDFVRPEALAFERSLLMLTADSFECELRRGRHNEVVADLERLAADNPLDERFCSLLMASLYRAGRQADALAAYKRLRLTLGEELGVEPGPKVQALELQVLNHDPELALSGAGFSVDEVPVTITRSSRTVSTAFLIMNTERLPLERVVTTIGRLPDRTVVVHDSDVSRKHAEIRRTANGFVLIDVGSTNGTMINGRRVSEELLQSGDRIEVGNTVFEFEET